MGNGYGQVAPTDLDAIRQLLQAHGDRITELERPTGTQQSEAVADLKARATYSAGNSSNTSFSSTLGDTSTGLSLAFSLAERRAVLVLSKVDVTMNVSLGGVLIPAHTTLVDGAVKGQANGDLAIGGAFGSGANTSLAWPLIGVHLLTVNAGQHTLTSTVSAIVTAPANGQFTSPALTAFVLQGV